MGDVSGTLLRYCKGHRLQGDSAASWPEHRSEATPAETRSKFQDLPPSLANASSGAGVSSNAEINAHAQEAWRPGPGSQTRATLSASMLTVRWDHTHCEHTGVLCFRNILQSNTYKVYF